MRLGTVKWLLCISFKTKEEEIYGQVTKRKKKEKEKEDTRVEGKLKNIIVQPAGN